MSQKTISDLRGHLFTQLENLCDPSKTVDLERARLVNETSQQIINTAKAEVEYMRNIGGGMMLPFIENQEGAMERPNLPAPAPQTDANTATPPSNPPDEHGDPQGGMVVDAEIKPTKPHPWAGLGKMSGDWAKQP